jgi:luciferase family oxidoreductase group 1
MLPNHAPLTIAEQFGTLAELFPGRIDLGMGRAPGTDRPTMRALRRSLESSGEDGFPNDVLELQGYLAPASGSAAVRAVPGQGTEVPIWLLGSSLYSAQLAAYLGLPFAFASHFAPEMLMQALQVYRGSYRPSARHPKPHAMVGLNVLVAPTDEEAQHLFTSLQQRFLGMVRGQRGKLPAPVASMDALWSPAERLQVTRMLSEAVVGSPQTVRAGLAATAERTGADEFIVACAVHDHAARRRSYTLLASI